MLDNEFAHRKPSPEIRYADYVVSGMGQGEDTTDGMTRIRRFKKEKFPQVLVSVNMGGFKSEVQHFPRGNVLRWERTTNT